MPNRTPKTQGEGRSWKGSLSATEGQPTWGITYHVGDQSWKGFAPFLLQGEIVDFKKWADIENPMGQTFHYAVVNQWVPFLLQEMATLSPMHVVGSSRLIEMCIH